MSKETVQVKRNEVTKYMIAPIFSEEKDSKSSQESKSEVTECTPEQSEQWGYKNTQMY